MAQDRAHDNVVAAPAGIWSRSNRSLTIGLIMTVVGVAFEALAVATTLPATTRDLGGIALYGWAFSAFMLTNLIGITIAGAEADRHGPARPYIVGVLLFALGLTIAGTAPAMIVLILGRAVQGFGAGVISSVAYVAIGRGYSESARPRMLAVLSSAWVIAALVGPALAGFLADHVGWRWVFLVNLPIGLGATVAAARLLREARDPAQRWPDWLGTVLLAAGVGLLALGLVRADAWGWGGGRTVACLGGAVAALALVAARSARHPSPVVEIDLLRVRAFALANAAALLFFVAFAAMLLGNVLFLTSVWGWSVLHTGLALAPGPAMAAVFAGPAGRLSGRIGMRSVAAAGGLLFATGSAWWLWRVGSTPSYAGGVLPGMMIGGTGVGLVLPSLSSAAALSLPPDRFATGTAILTAARQVGSVLGVALLVAILGDTPGASAFQDGWTLQIVAALAASGAAAAIGVVVPRAAAVPAAAEAAA